MLRRGCKDRQRRASSRRLPWTNCRAPRRTHKKLANKKDLVRAGTRREPRSKRRIKRRGRIGRREKRPPPTIGRPLRNQTCPKLPTSTPTPQPPPHPPP